MTRTLDTNASRNRHRAAIAFGTFEDADGRRVRMGYRYTCPRCGAVARTMKHRLGAEYQADRHALECRPVLAGKPAPRQ